MGEPPPAPPPIPSGTGASKEVVAPVKPSVPPATPGMGASKMMRLLVLNPGGYRNNGAGPVPFGDCAHSPVGTGSSSAAPPAPSIAMPANMLPAPPPQFGFWTMFEWMKNV